MTQTAFDFGDLPPKMNAKELRDAGIEQVMEHHRPWIDRALAAVVRLNLPAEFTGEDIHLLVSEIVGSTTPNAWGALINTLLRQGFIEETGRLRQSRRRESHARKNMIYRLRRIRAGGC